MNPPMPQTERAVSWTDYGPGAARLRTWLRARARRSTSLAIELPAGPQPVSEQPMNKSDAQPITPEPLESWLTGADDRLLLNHWIPPQSGIVPRIRIGRRWVNLLWGLPIGVTALVIGIAVAQS